MGTRRLMTISLPPDLLEKAARVAREENRSRSELVREALRFYVETTAARKQAARERVFEIIDLLQARTARTAPAEVRKVVRQAVAAARRTRSRSTA
jgi:metal-responsive CopG/Arc/MetJ family transcriptional regulator